MTEKVIQPKRNRGRPNVSVNSKPDQPLGKPLGNFFDSAKPRPLGQKNRVKTPPSGQLFLKSSRKPHKT